MAKPLVCAKCGRVIDDDYHDLIFDVDKSTGAICAKHLVCPDVRADITHKPQTPREIPAETHASKA